MVGVRILGMKEIPYIILYIGLPIILGSIAFIFFPQINGHAINYFCEGSFRNCLPGQEFSISFFQKIPFWLGFVSLFCFYFCYKIFEHDKIVGTIFYCTLGLGSFLLFVFYAYNVLSNYV